MTRPDGPMSLVSYEELFPSEHPGSLTLIDHLLTSGSGAKNHRLGHTWLLGENILQDWDRKGQGCHV